MNKKLLFWLQVASSMKFFFLQLKTFKTRIFVFRKCWCILRNIIFLYSRIWLFGVWLMNGCQHIQQVHVYMMFPVTHVKLSFTVKHWTRLKENYDPLADGDTYNILSYFTFYYGRRNYCLVYTVFFFSGISHICIAFLIFKAVCASSINFILWSLFSR